MLSCHPYMCSSISPMSQFFKYLKICVSPFDKYSCPFHALVGSYADNTVAVTLHILQWPTVFGVP